MSVQDSTIQELDGFGDESEFDFASDMRGCEEILVKILIAIIAGCAAG